MTNKIIYVLLNLTGLIIFLKYKIFKFVFPKSFLCIINSHEFEKLNETEKDITIQKNFVESWLTFPFELIITIATKSTNNMEYNTYKMAEMKCKYCNHKEIFYLNNDKWIMSNKNMKDKYYQSN